MGDMVNSWIKHHRMLRMSVNANTYEAKKSNILSIYETALRGRSIAKVCIFQHFSMDMRTFQWRFNHP